MPPVLGFELEWAVAEIGVTVVFIGVDNPIVCEVEVFIYILLSSVIVLERFGTPALACAIFVVEVVVIPVGTSLVRTNHGIAIAHIAEVDATHHLSEVIHIAHNAAVVIVLVGSNLAGIIAVVGHVSDIIGKIPVFLVAKQAAYIRVFIVGRNLATVAAISHLHIISHSDKA